MQQPLSLISFLFYWEPLPKKVSVVCVVLTPTLPCRLQDLLQDYGSAGQLSGWCNCKRCPETNGSLVEEINSEKKLICPKPTEYCFLKSADPSTYSEKMIEMCTDPTCQTCYDICKELRHCLDMKSRYKILITPFIYMLVLQERCGLLWGRCV